MATDNSLQRQVDPFCFPQSQNNNNTGENLGLIDHYTTIEMDPPSDRVPSISITLRSQHLLMIR